MGSPMRRTRDPLVFLREVEAAPWRHGFYGTLRQIECAYSQYPRIGEARRPQEEAVRLGQEPSLSFAPAVFSAIRAGKHGAPPRLVQQFFGLFGPNGPLPLHLTEFARQRVIHHRDGSFVRFADLLHHRLLTLFYRAWAQAQPTVSFDRPKADRFSSYVGSFVGMGTPAVQHRDAAGDHVRLHFAGLLSRQVRTAEGLRTMLAGYFRLPVRVVEFAGHWLRLPADDLTRLGGVAPSGALGQGAVLGSRVWDRQHRIRLVFGPLDQTQFQSLLPGAGTLKRLVALMRHYLCFELDWDLQLVVDGRETPAARLGGGTRLGWSSWIGSRPRTQDAADLILDPERLTRNEASS